MTSDLETINVNELVKVTTLPQIYKQLDELSTLISTKVDKLTTIRVTRSNKSEIKKYRSQLNGVKTRLETRRKEIKKEIIKPYNEFNSYYNDKVLSVIDNGLENIDSKIKVVEEAEYNALNKRLVKFFTYHAEALNIEQYVKFEDLNIKVLKSKGETNMKKEIADLCENISKSVALINENQNENERAKILNIYLHNGFNYASAISTFMQEKRALDELQEKINLSQIKSNDDNIVIQKFDEVIAPIEIDETIYTSQFTVRATKEQLKELKCFMDAKGISYD